MSACEAWAQRATILGTLTKVAVAGLFTEGVELSRLHLQVYVTAQAGGTAVATGMNWELGDLGKKGLISVNYGHNNAV